MFAHLFLYLSNYMYIYLLSVSSCFFFWGREEGVFLSFYLFGLINSLPNSSYLKGKGRKFSSMHS